MKSECIEQVANEYQRNSCKKTATVVCGFIVLEGIV